MFALTLCVLLIFPIFFQIVWIFKSRKFANRSKNFLWILFVVSVCVSSAVAVWDVLLMAESSIKSMRTESRAEKERSELDAPCTAGDANACARLGSVWMWGNGGPVDVEKAYDYYKKACKAGCACDELKDIEKEGGPRAYYYNRRLKQPSGSRVPDTVDAGTLPGRHRDRGPRGRGERE